MLSLPVVFSCNLPQSQPPPGPPCPPPPGTSAKWNNKGGEDSASASAAAKDGQDFKRVHFSLETLNTRRLLARMAASDTAKGGGAKGGGPGSDKPRVGPMPRPCENGGPPASLARLVLSLPSSSSSSSALPKAEAPPLAAVAPPRPGELEELQEQIEEMREKLRKSLARRAEIQTTLTKPVATVTANPSVPTTTPVTVLPPQAPPPVTPVTPTPTNRKCVTTMTDPPHKVLSKVRPLPRRLTNERR